LKPTRYIFILIFILFGRGLSFAQCGLQAVTNYTFDCLTSSAIASISIITGPPGPYTVVSSSPLITSITTSNLPMGVYNITVSTSPTCTAFTQLIVNNPYNSGNVAFTNTMVSCFGGSDGASLAFFQGSNGPPFSYTWVPTGSPSQTTQTAVNLSPGTYSVTIKDNKGCKVTSAVTIFQPDDIATKATNTFVTCFGGTVAAVLTSTGGTAPFNYTVNGTAIPGSTANVAAGVNTVIAKDSKGCIKTNTFLVTQVPQPLINFNITPPSCPSSSNGAVTASVSNAPPSYSYTWSPIPAFSHSLTGLVPGNYTLTVKDGSACITKSVAVVFPAVSMTMAANTNPENCSAQDGSAVLNITGGNFPYTFTTLPVGAHPTATLNNISSGTYTTVVQDGNGCVDSLIFVVSNLSTVSVSISSFTAVACYNNCTGAIQLSVQNAVNPVTYSATGSPTTSSNIITGMCAGFHIIKVTDAIGCPATTTINFQTPPVFSYSASGPTSICYGKMISMSATASGGSPGYTYVWNPGNVTGQAVSLSPLATTVYSLNVYDSNNCTLPPYTLTVNVAPPLSINIDAASAGICPGTTAQITPTVTGGDGNYVYNWLPGDINTSSIFVQNITVPVYTLQVNDGCGSPTAIKVVTINLFPITIPTYSIGSASGCEPFCTKFINTTPKSTAAIWNYGDKPFEQQGNSTNYCYDKAGLYNVRLTVTDSNSCKMAFTYTAAVSVLKSPETAFSSDPEIITLNNSENVSFINLTVDGTNYNWFIGGNKFSQAKDISYSYSDTGCTKIKLIARNQNNCVDSVEKNVCVIEGFNFWMPNAFTPNTDNMNEVLIPKGTAWAEKNYSFEVYNRWGSRIFQTGDIHQGWDGKAGDKLYDPSNIYYWKVSITDILDDVHEFRGHVMLFR
jgi:gliding motility-associated-like protein